MYEFIKDYSKQEVQCELDGAQILVALNKEFPSKNLLLCLVLAKSILYQHTWGNLRDVYIHPTFTEPQNCLSLLYTQIDDIDCLSRAVQISTTTKQTAIHLPFDMQLLMSLVPNATPPPPLISPFTVSNTIHVNLKTIQISNTVENIILLSNIGLVRLTVQLTKANGLICSDVYTENMILYLKVQCESTVKAPMVSESKSVSDWKHHVEVDLIHVEPRTR